MKKKILFEELKPDELEEIIKKYGIVYFPLGTLEWHQKHLPFGVDAFISYEICKRACQKTGGCVIPPVYFGTDREHKVNGKIFYGMDARAGRILPGSVYFLKQKFFYKFLKQVAQNVSHQGFKKLVIISGHSGTAQQQVIEKLAKEKVDNLKIIAFPGKLFAGSIDHAGKIETSLMLAIKPELVNLSKLKKPYEAMIGENPLKASKEAGIKQLHRIVNQITNKVKKA